MKRIQSALAISACCAMVWSVVAVAQEGSSKDEAPALKVGDKAPDFSLPEKKDADAKAPKKLSDFEGNKNVLVAFYPKAFTPVCTKEMCGYRDDFGMFESENTEVIAVSLDEQKQSDAFKGHYKLPFTVLGNANASIVKSYGVPIHARGDVHYAQRSVFLVDKKGRIQYIDLDYNIVKDKQALFDAIKKLNRDEAAK